MVGALLAALPLTALARTPPIAPDPREGVWLGAGDVVVSQAMDRWSVIPGQATVNKLAADGTLIWIATDDGVIRLDTGSRRATRLGMAEGLPSQAVSAVAVDDVFVWFTTNKGVARYRKLDRTIRVFDDANGLPHRAVNDAVVAGRLVWFATRGGVAVYDPDVDGLRAFTAADGLAGEDVAELYPVGDDLWCRTERGLSRLRVKERHFTNFKPEEIGGNEVRVFVQDGDRIWIGTENGLVSFEPTSDTFVPFPQQSALEGKAIVGVEPFTDYLFIATDKEIVQWHKTRRTIRRFTEADGLARRAGARGTVLLGGQLVLLFADGAEVYDIQRDHWTSRTLDVTEGGKQASGYRAWFKGNASEPYDLRAHSLSDQRYATAEGGAGVGYAKEGRSFDTTVRLDYGQLELSGIRDVDAKAEFLGRESDALREVTAGTDVTYRTVEEGLDRPFSLMGGHVRVATPGAEPKVQATADAGQRRGLSARDFLTGPRQDVYTLSHRYILPGSERVTVDGELLTSGTDYTVIYTAGQLAFLDPERVDDLSIVEIDYEYDLLSKKGLGVLSILDFLPADQEVGGWARAGDPQMVSDESGLYAQIDGAAPKYIDRGWVRSVYAEFRQGSRSLQIAVHDMGTEDQARNIYSFDLPPARETIPGHDDVVIDIGLATSYAIKAVSKNYYFELSIDEKSDAAKQSIKLFALEVLDRAENAGANHVPGPHPFFTAARVAASPTSGLELGGRAYQQTSGPQLPAASGTGTYSAAPGVRAGMFDARFERPVGEGRLTAYAEAAETGGTDPGGGDGRAGMAKLRLSEPWLEGLASGRWNSAGYVPLTSNRTYVGQDANGTLLYGALQSEENLQATAYPARWLPTTVFFSRQLSNADMGGSGTVQYALARVQLNKEHLPATSIQLGHTLVDSPTGNDMARIRVVGQTEYDLAQGPLSFLKMRRFDLRALYGISDATTDNQSVFTRGDRVQQMRVEARLAPTATETAYVLFRSRKSTFRLANGGDWSIGIEHWELTAGARSALIRGIVPQLNYEAIYNDDRITTATPVRTLKGSVGVELSIFPGQWWPALTPVLLDTRYSLSANDETDAELRTLQQRVHRIDNRFIYAGAGKLELELYQVVELPYAGSDQHRDGRRIELGNRVVYRPIAVSPITFRLDYTELQTANDTTNVPAAPPFGTQRNYQAEVNWLMRWTRSWTTKLSGNYSRGDTIDSTGIDKTTLLLGVQSYTQHRVGPGAEVRFLLPSQNGSLYLVQSNSLYWLFGDGSGALHGTGFDLSLGTIWTVADNLYLDSQVAYHYLSCSAGPCTPVSAIEPRILLSARY